MDGQTMKHRLVTVALVLACSASLGAWTYIGFEQITVAGTAIGFTAAKIDGTGGAHPQATMAVCRNETAQIRYTTDGTTPTSTVGTQLEIGDWLGLTGYDQLSNFRAIRTGSTSGKLNCTYYTP